MMLDSAAVRALLPHAPPMLFVDHVLDVEPGERAEALWRVPTDAFWVQGHFPGRPVLPGVLMVEALAQVCALVYLTLPDATGLPMLVGTERMRFRQPVAPGAELRLFAWATRTGRLWSFDVRAECEGVCAADGALLAARG